MERIQMWRKLSYLKTVSPVCIITDQECLENVEYFIYVGGLIINDAGWTPEIKPRIATAKAAFKKMTLFTSKLDLNLRKKLKNAESAETLKFQKIDHKYTESF